MIGLHLHWSDEPLQQPLAERFGASLGIGAGPIGVRAVDGAVLAEPAKDKAHARSWAPPRSPHGGHVLFFGHIDNRADLIRALPGNIDPSSDDASLYGQCNSAWGDSCDSRIVGQYAAILWFPTMRSIRIARSPILAPSLHYWLDSDRLIIASTARAIFATGEIDRKIDEQKIADSLFLNYNEEQRGWFDGVKRLPIGCYGHVRTGKLAITSYYDAANLPKVRYAHDAEYVDAARALFEEATRAALRGFSRPAVSLSGGFDSQAVAATAVKVLGPNSQVLGLTSVPESGWDGRTPTDRFGDERAHVAALAALYPSLEVAEVDSAGLSFDHKLDAMFLMAGLPPRNAMNLHWIHEVHSRAKTAGCDVVLTGAMGNATFSFAGTGMLPDLLKRGHWLKLLHEVRAISARNKTSMARTLASGAILPLLPGALFDVIKQWRDGAGWPDWCPLDPNRASEMQVSERANQLGFDPRFRALPSTTAYRMAMLGGPMNEGGDVIYAMDQIAGIPSRDPTSYRPLLEFCFGIPDDQYLRDGNARWLARRMLRGALPDMVLDEKRTGLQSADWHLRLGRQRGELMRELDRLSQNPVMAKRFDLPKMKAALVDWPEQTPIDGEPSTRILKLTLPRALAAARFIRYVEGANEH
jgi:asparagine synthase (glutamine-hydrolysing)